MCCAEIQLHKAWKRLWCIAFFFFKPSHGMMRLRCYAWRLQFLYGRGSSWKIISVCFSKIPAPVMLHSTAVIAGDHDSTIPDQYASVFGVRAHFQLLSHLKSFEAMWLTTTAAKTLESYVCMICQNSWKDHLSGLCWRNRVVHISEEQGGNCCLLEVIVVFTISIQSLCWLTIYIVYRYQTGRRVFSLIVPFVLLLPDRIVHSKLIRSAFFFFLISSPRIPRWFLSMCTCMCLIACI